MKSRHEPHRDDKHAMRVWGPKILKVENTLKKLMKDAMGRMPRTQPTKVKGPKNWARLASKVKEDSTKAVRELKNLLKQKAAAGRHDKLNPLTKKITAKKNTAKKKTAKKITPKKITAKKITPKKIT